MENNCCENSEYKGFYGHKCGMMDWGYKNVKPNFENKGMAIPPVATPEVKQ